MRKKVIPTLAAFAFAFIAISLGVWQAGRAQQKAAQFTQAQQANAGTPIVLTATLLDPLEVDHRRVIVRGEFLPEATIYLDNRLYKGAPGFFVLTPMRLDNGVAVVINRGWMPAPAAGRTTTEPPPTPRGMLSIEGHAVQQIASFMALRGAAKGKLGEIWPNFSFDAYAKESNLTLQPFVVQQSSALDDGLVRDWPSPGAGTEKNIGYALQWFLLAALSLGVWAWFVVIKPRRSPHAGADDGPDLRPPHAIDD